MEAWLETMIRTFSILAMDERAFRVWARLMHRKSGALNADVMIAATAIVHGLTIVTRNVRGFEQFRVDLVNPFGD